MQARYSPHIADLIAVCNNPAALAAAIQLTAPAPPIAGQPQPESRVGSFWWQSLICPALAWLGVGIFAGMVADWLGWLP